MLSETESPTVKIKTSVKWIVIGVVIIAIIISAFLIYDFLNRPRPEITMINGHHSLEVLNLVYVVDVSVKNDGGAGWIKVYAEISGYGKYEKQSKTMQLEAGETRNLKFTFDISLWGILGNPLIEYTAWAVAD